MKLTEKSSETSNLRPIRPLALKCASLVQQRLDQEHEILAMGEREREREIAKMTLD